MGIKRHVKQKTDTVNMTADKTFKETKKTFRKIPVIILLVVMSFILFIVSGRTAASKIYEKSHQIFDSIEEKYGIKINAGILKFHFPTITKNAEITFEKIKISYSGQSLAEMDDCSVTGFSSFLLSDTKKIDVKCLKTSLYADNKLKILKTLSKFSKQSISEEKNNQKEKRAGKSAAFTTALTIFSGSNRFEYTLESEISPESGKIYLQENNKNSENGKAEITFFPGMQKAAIRLDGIDLSAYREMIKKRTSFDIPEGRTDALINVKKENGTVVLQNDITVRNLSFFHPVIDSLPFNVPLFRFSGEISVNLEEKAASTHEAKISLGGIDVSFSGSYSRSSKEFALKTDSVSLNKLETLIHDGTFENYLFGGNLELFVEYSEKDGEQPVFSVTGNLVEPKQLSDRFDYLKRGFEYTFQNNEGKKRTIFVGEANPSFTPVSLIPDHLIWAVVVSEDAGFFIHKGIDFQELDAAVKDNIKNHKMRGGSTITQQLAKNLFLNRDKTLMRKFREVLLSIELDATLSKERLLEIYLNIIEWAPGIFGSSQAADYYFGKTPLELTPLESAYLASVIPGPAKYHYQFLTKNISENWYKSLFRILGIMNMTGHLSTDEYEKALDQTLTFRENEESQD